ncbi:hypothetical protein [Variovorax sp. PCZ-1]|uniref:hypothetical protein n=1 Tax=Variovorax sp. PCZ-1 TaxID=2835533 RepID=UPI001BD1A24F|nr:hypothetical protein [Variovorax sp. PCZ-1]MBS7807214.1 hypothetical protein [Variovorax sp. PCZ-1]
MKIAPHKNKLSSFRVLVAVGIGMMSAPAYAHGDFLPLVVFFGVVFLVIVASMVAGITVLVHRAARKRHVALGLSPATDQANERTPFWYGLVLFVLVSNLLLGVGGLMGFVAALGRGTGFSKLFFQALLVVLQIGLSLTAVIGIATFRRWGWWAGIALFAMCVVGLIGSIFAISTSTGGILMSRALFASLGAYLPLALGVLLLPFVRESFFGRPTPPKAAATKLSTSVGAATHEVKPSAKSEQSIRDEVALPVYQARLARARSNSWSDTMPGLAPQLRVESLDGGHTAAPEKLVRSGLSSAKRWVGGGVVVASLAYVLWIFAWPSLNSLRIGGEKSVLQASEPEAFFQPINLRPLSNDDYALIERYPPRDLPEPGQPHCRIGLYANSQADSPPILTIWRSKNGAHFLIFLNDGNEPWHGQAVQPDPGQQTARLGGQNPSLPFTVKFKLAEPGQPLEKSGRREIDIQIISKPAFDENAKRAKFNVKTSMKRYASMQAREDCASATLAYLSLSPELYSYSLGR